MALIQADIPEKRGGMGRLMGFFQTGSGLLSMGSKGKEGWQSLFGGGGTTSTGGGGGGAGYGLGLPAMNTVTDGMSPTLGGSASESTLSSMAPYAAPAVAAAATYQDYQQTGGQNVGPIGTSYGSMQRRMSTADKVSSGISDPLGATKTNIKSIGLGLTGDKMSAVERRYNSSANAANDIQIAQDALKDSGLPDADRRSIWQKLELARAKEAKRGPTSRYT